MTMMTSPPSRRSPRLAKHGLHPTPPSKATVAKDVRTQHHDVGGEPSDRMTTPIRGKKTNGVKIVKTPEPAAVRSPRSTRTPTRTGKSSVLEGKKSPRNNAAAGGPRTTRQTRRRAVTISPRTRGRAIASILASPGEFAGTKSRFLSPSKRSSAEATLHNVVKATKNGKKRSIDDVNGVGGDHLSVQRRKRRRKAASEANEKVRDICQLDEFDDLNNLTDADKIPYNKPSKGKKKSVSDLALGKTSQPSIISSNTADKPPVTVDTFIPKGKIEERWFRNLKAWASSQDDGPSTGVLSEHTSSIQRWVKEQRTQYRLLRQNKKTQMTQDRIALLEGAGFSWEVHKWRNATRSESEKVAAGERASSSAAAPGCASTINEEEGKSKSKVASKPVGKHGDEVDKARIDSPSKRKSPRKSLQTQFYHNLESGSSNEAKDGGESKTLSSPSKRESRGKEQSHTQRTGSNALAPSSTSSSSGKQSSPSKRRSLSTPSESLASLSATAGKQLAAKDKQKQGKKKKRSRRHSTSSLYALEVQTDISTGDSKGGRSKNGSSSLSHEELKQVLSTSKKKPARKKSNGGTAKKNGVSKPSKTAHIKGGTDENTSLTGKKSDTANPKAGIAPADGEMDNKDAKVPSTTAVEKCLANPTLQESPLQVRKLLPSLSDDTSEKSHAQNVIQGSDSKEKSADDVVPESMCVTKLLLSCLSEDSMEKGKNKGCSSQEADIKSSEKKSDNHNHSQPPRSSNAQEPREPISLVGHSSGDEVGGTNTAQSKSSALKSNQEETFILPSPVGKESNGTNNALRSHSVNGEGPRWNEQAEKKAVQIEHASAETATQQREAQANKNDSAGHMAQSWEGGSQKSAKLQLKPADGHPLQPTQWTCDVCQEATFDNYDDAVAHEKNCIVSSRNCAETDKEQNAAADPGKSCQPIDNQGKSAPKPKYPESEGLLALTVNPAEEPTSLREENEPSTSSDAHPEPKESWTCDVCKEATFEDYEEAAAHERSCNVTSNAQEGEEENEADVLEQRKHDSPVGNELPRLLTVAKDGFAQQQQSTTLDENESGACGVRVSSTTRNEHSIHHADNEATTAQTKRSSLALNNARDVSLPTIATQGGNELFLEASDKHGKIQSTPTQNREQNDEASSLFSPLSLTSPLDGNGFHHHDKTQEFQGGPNESAKDGLFSSSYLNGTPSQSTPQPAPVSRKELATELVNPSTLSLVTNNVASQNENLNVALSSGTLSESQLQMIVAEKRYQEKMARYGRIELEAKMVTKRMLEIEKSLKGLKPSTPFDGVSIEGHGSPRLYHDSKSKPLSQKDHTFSHHYESSEEEYSSQYNDPLGRSSNEVESNIYSGRKSSRRLDTYERSVKRVEVRSRSRHRESGRDVYSGRHDDSELRVESSRRSKKFDHHRAEHISSPERYSDELINDTYHSHDKGIRSHSGRTRELSKERSVKSGSRRSSSKRKQRLSHLDVDIDDYDSHYSRDSKNRTKVDRSPAFAEERPFTSKSRRSPSKRKQKMPHHGSGVKDDSPQRNKKRSKGDSIPVFAGGESVGDDSRKHPSDRKRAVSSMYSDVDEVSVGRAAAHQTDRIVQEELAVHSTKSLGKPSHQLTKSNSKSPIKERATQLDEKITNTDDRLDSDTASTHQSSVPQGSEPTEEKNAVSATKKNNINDGGPNQQVNQSRDPLYWLAGGENSSDDESWDFDGPMILPPPPI